MTDPPGPAPIARPRLTALADGRPLVLISGSGGFGKSTLLRQLATAGSNPAVVVELRRPVGPETLIDQIARAAAADGLTDLTAVLVGATDRVAAKLQALLAAGTGVTLGVDEIGFLDDAAADWLAGICRAGDLPNRVLLAGREVPEQLSGLDAAEITEAELAFTREETAALLGDAGGVGLDPVDLLQDLTGGWPAAVAVAVSRRSAQPRRQLWELATAVPDESPADTPTAASLLIGLGDPDRVPLPIRALVSLPLLSPDLAGLLLPEPDLSVLAGYGIPLTRRFDGWWETADPVRERLGDPDALDPDLCRRVARHYADHDALPAGLSLLAARQDFEGIARLITDASWTAVERLGGPELRLRVDSLPEPVLARHPTVLLRALRLREWPGSPSARSRWLDQAERLVPASDGRWPAVQAERARELVRAGRAADAIAVADGVLARADADPRSRGTATLAKAQAVTSGDRASQLEAGRILFQEAALHFRDAGERRWEAEAWSGLGYSVDFSLGAFAAAAEHLARAATLHPTADPIRAQLLSLLSEVLLWLPDHPAAAAAAAEAEQIAQRTFDPRTIAYAQWCWAWVTSRQGDPAATRIRVAAAMERRGDWSRQAVGVTMHAEFAGILADVGDEIGARHQLELARQVGDALGYLGPVGRAEALVNAKVGDPAAGLAQLQLLLADPDLTPLYRWQYLALTAWCHHRQADETVAAGWMEQAVRAANALGHPPVLAALEPELARWAAGLGGRTDTAGPVQVRLFRAVQIRRDQADVPLPPGHAAELVAMVAAEGGVPVEEVVDRLWPEADRATGRSRLRNLLNRLRAHSGDLLVRDGARLTLVDRAEVDVDRFRRAGELARTAVEADRPGLARQALAGLDWPVLPEFDGAWAVPVRAAVRRLALVLIDLVAADAVAGRDLDEACRLLEQGIELEPHDEVRYVRLTTIYQRQGRRGSARAVLRRAMAMTTELGVPPSPALAALVRELGRPPGAR